MYIWIFASFILEQTYWKFYIDNLIIASFEYSNSVFIFQIFFDQKHYTEAIT